VLAPNAKLRVPRADSRELDDQTPVRNRTLVGCANACRPYDRRRHEGTAGLGGQMAGWYVLSKNEQGQYAFALMAGNREVVLRSELYTRRRAAEQGIASVRANCATQARYERKVSSDGRFYFNLRAANHRVIGTSQMYATASSRDGGIASVKMNGFTTLVKSVS
jgi:uncharacterized protein YegP (UPF0339 family)